MRAEPLTDPLKRRVEGEFVVKNILVLTAVLFSGVVNATDGYICIADKSTGFTSENGEWQPVNFDVAEKRYFVRKATEEDVQSTAPWVYGEFGQSVLAGQCDEPFPTGLMNCHSGTEEFKLNTKTMRYQLYYWVGYVVSHDRGVRRRDTPFIEIGKCSPLG